MARPRNRPDGGGGEAEEPAPRPVDLLNSKRRATLDAIFQRPTRSDVPWRDVERLFEALGGVVT